jgi:Family of unknown function (DUF5677)
MIEYGMRELTDNKLVALLRAVAADSVKDVALFRIDKSHPQELVAVCIYATILELSQGELALLDQGPSTALPLVLRSLLEAYADLRAVLEDPGYHNKMYASFVSERRRLLHNVEKPRGNPFLLESEERLDVAAEILRLKAELQGHLDDDGDGPHPNEPRFASGKLGNHYLSIHSWLCLRSHNSMTALDDRYIEKVGDDYHVVLFREATPGDIARIVDTLASVLINSAVRLHSAFGTEATLRYQLYREAFDAIRGDFSINAPS